MPKSTTDGPKVRVEVPGYWSLPAEDQAEVDRVMRERKAEREKLKGQPPQRPTK